MTIIKTFVATCLLIVILQIQVNQQTLEVHLHHWLQSSPVTANLREVAQGAVVASKNLYKKTENQIKDYFSKEEPPSDQPHKASRL